MGSIRLLLLAFRFFLFQQHILVKLVPDATMSTPKKENPIEVGNDLIVPTVDGNIMLTSMQG
jgi:hypothetical protein